MAKFTFKTDKPTGKWKSFDSPSHYIKLKGISCGMIDNDAPHTIRLQVIKKDVMEDGNKNCPWKWIRLKKESATLQEAKDFVAEKTDAIIAMYNLHLEK